MSEESGDIIVPETTTPAETDAVVSETTSTTIAPEKEVSPPATEADSATLIESAAVVPESNTIGSTPSNQLPNQSVLMPVVAAEQPDAPPVGASADVAVLPENGVTVPKNDHASVAPTDNDATTVENEAEIMQNNASVPVEPQSDIQSATAPTEVPTLISPVQQPTTPLNDSKNENGSDSSLQKTSPSTLQGKKLAPESHLTDYATPRSQMPAPDPSEPATTNRSMEDGGFSLSDPRSSSSKKYRKNKYRSMRLMEEAAEQQKRVKAQEDYKKFTLLTDKIRKFEKGDPEVAEEDEEILAELERVTRIREKARLRAQEEKERRRKWLESERIRQEKIAVEMKALEERRKEREAERARLQEDNIRAMRERREKRIQEREAYMRVIKEEAKKLSAKNAVAPPLYKRMEKDYVAKVEVPELERRKKKLKAIHEQFRSSVDVQVRTQFNAHSHSNGHSNGGYDGGYDGDEVALDEDAPTDTPRSSHASPPKKRGPSFAERVRQEEKEAKMKMAEEKKKKQQLRENQKKYDRMVKELYRPVVDDAKKGAIERKRREDQLKEELRMAKKMGSPVDAIVRRAKALDDPDGGLFLPAATDDAPIVSPVLAAGGGSSSSPKRSLDPVPSIEKKKKEHLLESAQQKSRKLEELATQKALELRDDPPLDTETNVDQQANLSSLYLDAIIGQLSALEAVK
jgi:hypothetical protein